MVPLMEERLELVSQKVLLESRSRTHVQSMFPVTAKNATNVPKVNTLGTREATSRNFANSFDVHALSR